MTFSRSTLPPRRRVCSNAADHNQRHRQSTPKGALDTTDVTGGNQSGWRVMGKRQRDCVECGAPVGFLDREHCCRCMRRRERAVVQTRCPGCGIRTALVTETGRCVLCSRRCRDCGGKVRFRGEVVCRPCQSVSTGSGEVDVPALRQARLSAGSPPGGADLVRAGRPKDPPGSARTAVNYAATLGAACAGDAGSAIPTGFVRGETLAARLVEPPDWLRSIRGSSGCVPVPGPRMCADHRTGAALLPETILQPSAAVARAVPPPGPLGGIAGTSAGSLLHRTWLAIVTDQSTDLPPGVDRTASMPPTGMRLGVSVRRFHGQRPRTRPPCRHRPHTDRTIETALASCVMTWPASSIHNAANRIGRWSM